MVKYFCDRCEAELPGGSMIAVQMHGTEKAEEMLLEKTNKILPFFQLCPSCAYSVYRFVKEFQKLKTPSFGMAGCEAQMASQKTDGERP